MRNYFFDTDWKNRHSALVDISREEFAFMRATYYLLDKEKNIRSMEKDLFDATSWPIEPDGLPSPEEHVLRQLFSASVYHSVQSGGEMMLHVASSKENTLAQLLEEYGNDIDESEIGNCHVGPIPNEMFDKDICGLTVFEMALLQAFARECSPDASPVFAANFE